MTNTTKTLMSHPGHRGRATFEADIALAEPSTLTTLVEVHRPEGDPGTWDEIAVPANFRWVLDEDETLWKGGDVRETLRDVEIAGDGTVFFDGQLPDSGCYSPRMLFDGTDLLIAQGSIGSKAFGVRETPAEFNRNWGDLEREQAGQVVLIGSRSDFVTTDPIDQRRRHEEKGPERASVVPIDSDRGRELLARAETTVTVHESAPTDLTATFRDWEATERIRLLADIESAEQFVENLIDFAVGADAKVLSLPNVTDRVRAIETARKAIRLLSA